MWPFCGADRRLEKIEQRMDALMVDVFACRRRLDYLVSLTRNLVQGETEEESRRLASISHTLSVLTHDLEVAVKIALKDL